MRKITILLLPENRILKIESYLVWYIAQEWQKAGLHVEFVYGIPKHPDIDILFPHLDTTRIPARYCRFIRQHKHVLNQQVFDISKRKVSTNLLSKSSGYDGPVIVKTDANYGGLPEFYSKTFRSQITDTMYRWFKPAFIRKINPGQYHVYDHISQVSEIVWKNRHLVVERFIAERQDDLYCIRVCHFLGDVVLNNKVFSKSRVIKGNDISHVEPTEVPMQLMAIRNSLGFDYGKFDYVIHEGQVHLLDANKTLGVVSNIELNARIAQKLAKGIFSLIDQKFSPQQHPISHEIQE